MSEAIDVTFREKTEWYIRNGFAKSGIGSIERIEKVYEEHHPKAATEASVLAQFTNPNGDLRPLSVNRMAQRIADLENAQPTDATLRRCAEEIANKVRDAEDRKVFITPDGFHAILARHIRGAE